MMMMGLYFMKDVPFRTVYIHALVRDAKGQKMSKSKGNILDPLVLIDKYGADAVRFTLAALAAQGRDIKLAESRIEGYRNFATKLWNAARYVEMNEGALPAGFDPGANRATVNRWIVTEVMGVTRQVAAAFDAYKFNEAANALYQFIWGSYCDWYVEFTKPILQGGDGTAKTETRATLLWVLHRILHLLHPIMPFITEELWEKLGAGASAPLIVSRWPEVDTRLIDDEAAAEMNWVIRLISEIRAVRSEMNVPPGARIPLLVQGAGPRTKMRLDTHRDIIRTLARLATIEHTTAIPKGCAQTVIDEATLVLPLADVIDIAQERERLKREIAKLAGEIEKIERKLSNAQFTAKAPPEVVEEQRERMAEAEQARAKLAEALKRVAAA
jgi:valyl-tRNA synthetase